MKTEFPIVQLRHALQDTSKIKALLKPFLAQFKNNNMFFITHTVQELYRYLTDNTVQINIAFNSLFAVKVIVDKADFVIMSVIQAYLLPKILEIASFEMNKQSKNRGDNYFISKGFKGEKSLLQYYGFNFIRIACELIMVSAQIKPNKLAFNQEIKDPSDFSLCLRKLKLKGFKLFENYVFYKERNINEARNKYLSNLMNYHRDIVSLAEHTKEVIRDFLQMGTAFNNKINPLKLAEKGQATLSTIVMQQCSKRLDSKNLKQRRRALQIINDFVRWGDILPYFQINYKKSVKKIIEQVSNLEGRSSTQGFASLSHYNNNQIQKRLYYSYLLESIRLWSECYPYIINCPHRSSYIKQLADLLEKKGFQMPRAETLYVQKAEFIQNIKRNNQISNRVKRKYLIQQFQDQLRAAKKVLKEIETKQANIQEHYRMLSAFQRDYDVKIVNSYFNRSDMQYITMFGSPLIQTVQLLLPLLEKYLKRQLSYHNMIKQFSLAKNALLSSNLPPVLKIKQTECQDNFSIVYKQQQKLPSIEEEQQDLLAFRYLQTRKPKKDNTSQDFLRIQYKQPLKKVNQSINCLSIPQNLESIANINKKQRSFNPETNNQQVYSINLLVDQKARKKHKKSQSSEIIRPGIQPKLQSQQQQDSVIMKKSFLEYLAADNDQIVFQQRERASSLKLLGSSSSNVLKKSQERDVRSKYVNKKFNQLYKLTGQNLISKLIEKGDKLQMLTRGETNFESLNHNDTLKFSSNKGTSQGASVGEKHLNFDNNEYFGRRSQQVKQKNRVF